MTQKELLAKIKVGKSTLNRDLAVMRDEGLFGTDVTHPKLADIDRKKFGWNVLRHTFCTGHLDAGVATGIVCQWSGHTEKVFWTNYAGHIREYDDRINMIDDQQTKIT